jgi:hypothetical protein
MLPHPDHVIREVERLGRRVYASVIGVYAGVMGVYAGVIGVDGSSIGGPALNPQWCG